MNEHIKQLAEQAGLDPEVFHDNQLRLDDFAELIRLDETKACAKHYLEIMRDAVEAARQDERNKCAQDYLQDCADAVEAARVEEREACAKIIDPYDSTTEWAKGLADAIRQRGEK